MTQDRGTTALITGASSGLGVEFATRLAERGVNVVLVARRADRLRELADRIQSTTGVTATPIALDLSDPTAPAQIRAELDARGIRVDSLINNAGLGAKGTFATGDLATEQRMIDVNITAMVAMTHEFLPDMVASNKGMLINISSVGGYQPCPQMAVYGASKAFVLSFTEALSYENRDNGLRVVALSPGPTRTEFFDVVGDASAAVGRMQTPQQVVATALREVDRARPRPSVVSGWRNALVTRLSSILPRRMILSISGQSLA